MALDEKVGGAGALHHYLHVSVGSDAGTESTPTSSINLDYSVALYIMISIAGVYFILTLLCCFLVLLNW